MIKRSESITEICKALIQVAGAVGKIHKSAENPFFRSKYAPLPEVQEALRQPLINAGLCYTQHAAEGHKLVTLVMHQSGEWMESSYDICPVPDYIKDTDIRYIKPQALGSAITYAKRYALVSIFALNIDDDDDGNEASKPPQNKKAPANKPAPPVDGKPWLNPGNETWDKVVTAINDGYTLEDVKTKYKLSKVNEAKLQAEEQKAWEVKQNNK